MSECNYLGEKVTFIFLCQVGVTKTNLFIKERILMAERILKDIKGNIILDSKNFEVNLALKKTHERVSPQQRWTPEANDLI